MSKRWSFDPEDPYRPAKRRKYKPRSKENPATAWLAPEHIGMVKDMVRDYPRDDRGDRIPGSEREFVLDKRPAIMIPPRKTIIGYK